jgi:chromosomal replication initiation ATPase DnaA
MIDTYNNEEYYNREDLFAAYQHAYHLALSGNKEPIVKTFEEYVAAFKAGVKQELTLDDVIRVIADMFCMNEFTLRSSNRQRVYLMPRRLVAWFAWYYTESTLQSMTTAMCRTNHTSMMYARDELDSLLNGGDEHATSMVRMATAIFIGRGYVMEKVYRTRIKSDD